MGRGEQGTSKKSTTDRSRARPCIFLQIVILYFTFSSFSSSSFFFYIYNCPVCHDFELVGRSGEASCQWHFVGHSADEMMREWRGLEGLLISLASCSACQHIIAQLSKICTHLGFPITYSWLNCFRTFGWCCLQEEHCQMSGPVGALLNSEAVPLYSVLVRFSWWRWEIDWFINWFWGERVIIIPHLCHSCPTIYV